MTGPELVTATGPLRERVGLWRSAGERVGLVPTMGALHEGHLALVRRARDSAGRVVVSIFVNPTQFGAGEDFAAYPRTLPRDRELLAGLADLVYAPSPETMYPPGFGTTVSVSGPSRLWEAEIRPGHFAGVATVVAKLLIQAAPDLAMFGEKDWQQLQVVRRMARDLDLTVDIIGHPTVRDEAGLALSSRNAYLSPAELALARRFNAILREVRADLARRTVPEALASGRAGLASAGLGPLDYLALVESESLEPLAALDPGRPARLLAAVRLGPVRLLDNLPVPEP